MPALQLIEVKEELNLKQKKIVMELNEDLEKINKFMEDADKQQSPYYLSTDMLELSQHHIRLGAIRSDLGYDLQKVVDIRENETNETWVNKYEETKVKRTKNRETGSYEDIPEQIHSATACKVYAERAIRTSDQRKKERIARWLHEKTSILYDSLDKFIQVTKKKYDSLVNERRMTPR